MAGSQSARPFRREKTGLAAGLLLILAGCAAPPPALPPFAAHPYQPISRGEIVAVSLREWRLFGSPIDDGTAKPSGPPDKPERDPGLWERVGEYWWIGLAGRQPEAAWTGKHDDHGNLFPPEHDEQFAWSAAFISYVMRVAGAGSRFPYSADHATYVNDAASGRNGLFVAEAPERYAPRPGDLICFGRRGAQALRFSDLPTTAHWPGHCAVTVAASPGEIDVVGGNVSDAVTLSRVPVDARGLLVGNDGATLDRTHPWFVVLRALAGD